MSAMSAKRSDRGAVVGRRVEAVHGRIVLGEQFHQILFGLRAIAARRELEGERHLAGEKRAQSADDLRLIAFGVDPDQTKSLRRQAKLAERVLDPDHGNLKTIKAVIRRRCADGVCALVARVQMQHRGPGGLAGRLRHDRHGGRKPVRLDVHGQQPRILRFRLEGDRARKSSGAQRVDRVGADIGADIDEHRVRRKPAAGGQHGHRLVDLAALPAAVPHQPGPHHPVGRVDEEPRITEIAEHEVAARGQRVHDGVAQHRPADQQRLQHGAPQRAAAAAIGPLDLAPRRHRHLRPGAHGQPPRAASALSSMPCGKATGVPSCQTMRRFSAHLALAGTARARDKAVPEAPPHQ